MIRWSDDPGGLSVEECARRGIEAVAGLVISGDIFGTNNFPDAHFCACADMHHVATGAGKNFDDHIGVSFCAVEIRDGIYPMVGPESVKMIMQPLADGNVSASWDVIDGSSPAPFPGNQGLLVGDVGLRSRVCRPMELGEMSQQENRRSSSSVFPSVERPGGRVANLATLHVGEKRWPVGCRGGLPYRDIHDGVPDAQSSHELAVSGV